MISSEWFYSLSENTLQNMENAKTARVITPSNTRLPSLNFQNIFTMCYSTFSLLWSVYKYALFVVEREKTTKSPFEGKKPRAITLWVLNRFSQKLQGRRSSSRWLFFFISVYTKYVLFVLYCRKTTNSDFDLEIWSLYKKVCQIQTKHPRFIESPWCLQHNYKVSWVNKKCMQITPWAWSNTKLNKLLSKWFRTKSQRHFRFTPFWQW